METNPTELIIGKKYLRVMFAGNGQVEKLFTADITKKTKNNVTFTFMGESTILSFSDIKDKFYLYDSEEAKEIMRSYFQTKRQLATGLLF